MEAVTAQLDGMSLSERLARVQAKFEEAATFMDDEEVGAGVVVTCAADLHDAGCGQSINQLCCVVHTCQGRGAGAGESHQGWLRHVQGGKGVWHLSVAAVCALHRWGSPAAACYACPSCPCGAMPRLWVDAAGCVPADAQPTCRSPHLLLNLLPSCPPSHRLQLGAAAEADADAAAVQPLDLAALAAAGSTTAGAKKVGIMCQAAMAGEGKEAEQAQVQLAATAASLLSPEASVFHPPTHPNPTPNWPN